MHPGPNSLHTLHYSCDIPDIEDCGAVIGRTPAREPYTAPYTRKVKILQMYFPLLHLLIKHLHQTGQLLELLNQQLFQQGWQLTKPKEPRKSQEPSNLHSNHSNS